MSSHALLMRECEHKTEPVPTRASTMRLCASCAIQSNYCVIEAPHLHTPQLMPEDAPWSHGPGWLKAGASVSVCVCVRACRLVCQTDAHNPVCSTQSIKSALSLMRTVPGTNACPEGRIHNREELGEFISKITRAVVGTFLLFPPQILSWKRSKQPFKFSLPPSVFRL